MCNCSPFLSYPRWPLLHTLCLSHAVCAPQSPPPFLLFCSVFTCNLSLNVQCLSCSGVLRPSQWIGSSFGAEVTAPPFPIILPSSLPSSPPPPGQAAGVGNGPDVRCMVDGRAAPAPRAPAAGGSAGLRCPCVPRAPPPPHPTRSRRQREELPPHPPLSAPPAPQTAGPAHSQPPGCRQEQARLFRAGEVRPSRANLLRSVSPPCRLPPRSDAHRRPHALRHDTAFVLLIW